MPAYAFEIEMAQNSNHSFFSYFFLEILITFHLLVEVAQFFKLEYTEITNSFFICCEKQAFLSAVK